MAARLATYVVVAIVAATLIAGLIVGAQRDDSSGPVDLIIHNAKVYSADALGSTAEAIAVRGNTILHVGTNREILRYRRPQTTMIDAKGVAVLPGFNDAHAAFIAGGLARDGVDLFGADTLDDMQARISEWADAHPDAGWITGHGWSYQRFADLPTRTQLDAAVKDHPVAMFSQDGHAVWLNSKAVAALHLARHAPDPRGGVIVRDPRGEPTGLFKDTAVALVTRAMPQPTREERARALRLAIRDAQEHGITSVQDLGGSTADFEVYDEARRAGTSSVRVYAGVPDLIDGGARRLTALDALAKRYADDGLLKTGLAVVALDGSVESQTAAMLAPYSREADQRHAEARRRRPEPHRHDARRRGWQIAVDAAGDRAVRLALDAYQLAAVTNTHAAGHPRHRIEGIEVVDADDLPRFGALGIIASLQPAARENGSSARSGRATSDPIARRSACVAQPRRGRRAPRVRHGLAAAAFDPLAGLNAAVNRGTTPKAADAEAVDQEPPAEDILFAGERLALKSAINAWTSGAAWASFDEHRKGMIKPGMLADLVVLSSDILKDAPEALATAEVDVTIFDGRVVYERNRRHSTN